MYLNSMLKKMLPYSVDIYWLTIVIKSIVAIACISLLLPNVDAIQCWQCNSAIDKFCEDVPSGPMEEPEQLHDCYKKMYKECVAEDEKHNYTFCRKQVQTIDKETRIIRACGFIKASQDCYWTKNPPASTLVCQCEGDGCNRSPRVSYHHWIWLPIVLSLVLQPIFYQ
ncbi:calmodulin-lysine N-methyltransferase-like [Sarcoptes scabiei]|nr:calmodulin-lysine N-methyltransferase-like [Sarcoptes scabiei]